jgi:cytidylate kinase
LHCSFKERAKRRQAEMRAKGIEISLEIVEKNLQERDVIDYTGDTPTSRKAIDARELDTTYLTIEEQIAIVVGWAKDILAQ